VIPQPHVYDEVPEATEECPEGRLRAPSRLRVLKPPSSLPDLREWKAHTNSIREKYASQLASSIQLLKGLGNRLPKMDY
jgi:hypothetical protein